MTLKQGDCTAGASMIAIAPLIAFETKIDLFYNTLVLNNGDRESDKPFIPEPYFFTVKEGIHFNSSNPTLCPINEWKFVGLKNSNDTYIDESLYSNLITNSTDCLNETCSSASLKFAEYGGADASLFNNLSVMFQARTYHAASIPTAVAQLNIFEVESYEPAFTYGPYFAEPLEDINIVLDFANKVKDNLKFDKIVYELPELKDKDQHKIGDTIIQEIEAYPSFTFDGFILTIDPNKLTRKDVRKGIFELVIETTDENEDKGEHDLEINI